jgi:hypothetical protein
MTKLREEKQRFIASFKALSFAFFSHPVLAYRGEGKLETEV